MIFALFNHHYLLIGLPVSLSLQRMTGFVGSPIEFRGFFEEEKMDKALNAVELMNQQGGSVSVVILYSLFEWLTRKKDLSACRRLHSFVVKSGSDAIHFLSAPLIRMLGTCGCLLEANQVFCRISKPGVYTWNAIISAHAKLAEEERAVALFYEMQHEGIKADRVTFLCILNACGSIGNLRKVRLIHNQIIRDEYDSDVAIGSALVHIYTKCGGLVEACKVFDELPNRNVVSWGAMITGYAQNGHESLALQLFGKMLWQGIMPGKVTFLCILKACSNVRAIVEGRLLHDQIVRGGFGSDVLIGSSLVNMYCKCGSLAEAHRLFKELSNRDVVSWAALISGYAQHGHGLSALELFEDMKREGIEPDTVTFLCILKACGNIAALQKGRFIHDQIIKRKLESDVAIANSLVDMYAKSGSLEEAHRVFDGLANRNVASCGAMISGCLHQGHGFPAFEIFEKMKEDEIHPDKVMLLCLLKACGNIGAVSKGKVIHMNLIKSGLESDLPLGNTLIDMYAKGGCLDEAYAVFDNLPNRDMVTWHAMISGYAQLGNYRLAVECLEGMQCQGLKPDDVIFVSILASCSYTGLLEEGCWHLNSMREDHGISPKVEHYNCMVDLLGRVGHFYEAEDLLQTMPVFPNIISWTSLLMGCRTHRNKELGQGCFDQLFQLEPQDASVYMIMSSIYTDTLMWEDADRLQQLRKLKGLWKKPGKAWVEVNMRIHEFVVGGQSHPQGSGISMKLSELGMLMKGIGYVPQLDEVVERW